MIVAFLEIPERECVGGVGTAFNYFDLPGQSYMGRKHFSKAASSTHSHTMEQKYEDYGVNITFYHNSKSKRSSSNIHPYEACTIEALE